MNILVVGAGAVGGYFGARLAQAGRNVSFLVRPERADLLRQRGLRIRSPHGDFKVEPVLVFNGGIDRHYDLVLISVKAYTLEAAIADLAPAVGPQTIILPVLNGMRHLDLLQARFGVNAVLGGTAAIFAEVDHERRIVQYADIHRLTYGELSGGISERIRAVDAALSHAGFDTLASSTIVQGMWEKWVQLASLGAVTTLLRGTIGEIVAARAGTEISTGLVEECAAIATACGHPPSEQLLRSHLETMTQAGSSLTASIYRDMRRGVNVEAEHILGDLHARGCARGVSAPLLKTALVGLRVYVRGLAQRI
jgi:2-dehydropantoate 2-reductase